jgi:hypothetical protein
MYETKHQDAIRTEVITREINSVCATNICVGWVPCHHGMARPQVTDAGCALQVWREAANILNKKSRTADKG